MATQILMPALSPTMTEGKLARWLKKPGDEVRAGDVAVAHCRAGKGPYLLEVMTYRYRGHSMSDPAKYRTREEVQKMRTERDCIEGARRKLLDMGVGEDELKRVEDEVKRVVQEAADFAQTSPEPDPKELWTDVLVEG